MLGKRGPYAGKFKQRRKRAKYVQTHGTGLGTKPYGPGYQPGQRRSFSGRPELLHYTTGLNLTSLDTAPSGSNPALYHIQTLNNIAQGDTGDGRKGNKICAKKLTVRMKCQVDPNSDGVYTNLVSSGHVFRVLIYLDTRPNGNVVTLGQVLDPFPANDGQLYSYNNIYAKNRFKVLSDKWLQVEPSYMLYDGTNYHSGGNFKFFKVSIPLDCEIWYSDATNNYSAIQENNIGIFIMSDASTTAYPTMKFSYRSQLRYTDS